MLKPSDESVLLRKYTVWYIIYSLISFPVPDIILTVKTGHVIHVLCDITYVINIPVKLSAWCDLFYCNHTVFKWYCSSDEAMMRLFKRASPGLPIVLLNKILFSQKWTKLKKMNLLFFVALTGLGFEIQVTVYNATTKSL